MSPVASNTKSILVRTILFCGLWLTVAGFRPQDLPIGLAAAVGAAWTSMRLAPPASRDRAPLPVLMLVWRFLRGSIVAGFDVALRALSPRMNLKPGFVACPLAVPAGDMRNVFCFYQSLQPGVLPTGVENGDLILHGLDTRQPIRSNVASDEALFQEATRP